MLRNESTVGLLHVRGYTVIPCSRFAMALQGSGSCALRKMVKPAHNLSSYITTIIEGLAVLDGTINEPLPHLAGCCCAEALCHFSVKSRKVLSIARLNMYTKCTRLSDPPVISPLMTSPSIAPGVLGAVREVLPPVLSLLSKGSFWRPAGDPVLFTPLAEEDASGSSATRTYLCC